MRKITAILCLVGIVALNACRRETNVDRPSDVIASVDSEQLTLSRMLADMPSGFSSGDSLTFARLYVDNWIMRRLKMREASELLCSSQEDIDRLVEGYRQSLIMRKLDQYYIDNENDRSSSTSIWCEVLWSRHLPATATCRVWSRPSVPRGAIPTGWPSWLHCARRTRCSLPT